ncbi:hypothetical protein B9Z65_2624 [Elsinoe australis]|uniref:Uncharacterized protein n=1 Tax=Elsinoe australis TaxID=40998 RepID=A0A2P8A434_9PEZI|nr:hypothetical protein B9Z65_2624 [Elsinoe australis]
MVEIPSFVRRRSARKSLSEDQLLSPTDTTETTTTTRSDNSARRLTKPRQHTDSYFTSQRSDSVSRGSRRSLVDLKRKSFDRKSFRNSFFSSDSANLEDLWSQPNDIVEEPLEIDNNCPEDSDNDNETMSPELLKTVAKKTSLKNILCDNKPTSEDDGIDIDYAITLLQELKKKASPEELVALHRALLPTKPGKAKNNVDESTVSPYSRRSSMVMPGIATRSKSPGKSPKDARTQAMPSMPTPVKKQRPLSVQLDPVTSNKAALLTRQTSCMELPPHKGVPSLSRSYSPADLDAIGGLRLGTLRVTNGAVSPEPSIASQSEAEDYTQARKSSHGRSHSEPQTGVQWTAEDAINLREDSTTPKANKQNARNAMQTNRSSVIPGLDAYTDSSEDEELTAATPRMQAAAFGDNQASDPQTTPGPYKKPTFNVSLGSIISRLSTIQDDESIAESRSSTPADLLERIDGPSSALERLLGHGVTQSPPPSSGSDTSSSFVTATPHRLSPLHSNPRPAALAKSSSGYGSDTVLAGRSSDEDSVTTYVPSFSRPTSWGRGPAKKPSCQLETIPSVSDILSSVDGDERDGSDMQCPPDVQNSRPTTVIPARSQLVPPPMYRNPASTSSSNPSDVSTETEMSDVKSPEKTPKLRKKLYKPPPVKRNSSSEVLQSPMSPSLYPNVPDDLSVNFSRRISRVPGTFHPEHAFAAQAQMSRESLERTEQMNQSSMSPRTEQAPFTPSRTATPSMGTPASEPGSAEPDLQKKKSRFRLGGRSRSKSLARPEVHLPRESGIPTVADTVLQFAEIAKVKAVDAPTEKEARQRSASRPRAQTVDISLEKAARQRSASRPRFYAEFSAKEYDSDYPAIERVSDQRWSPRIRQDSFEDVNKHKRSESVPRPPAPADRRQSEVGGRASRQDNSSRRARSKSVAAHVNRVTRDDADDERTAIPQTPKSKFLAENNSTPREVQSEPKPEEPRRERRNTFTQVFLRSTSREKSPRAGRSRSSSRSPKLPDVNNPAYIASRWPEPEPRLPYPLPSPRAVPWDSEKTPSNKPRSGQATPVSFQAKSDVSRNDSAVSTSSVHTPANKTPKSSTPRSAAPLTSISTNVQGATDKDADGVYRAYRASDAVSITQLTSPTRELARDPIKATPNKQTTPKQAHVAGLKDKQRPSRGSENNPASPDSLFDRFGGGLDYGWERGNGFSGSAGTRTGAGDKAHRKSLVLSESYGVDLSDVPVFITKRV